MARLTNVEQRPAVTDSPTREVPPEIWLHIFRFLRRDKPAPLSRPKRADLRQGGLCALSRVSRSFESLVRPLLYSTVVTDTLHGFLSCCRTPSMQQKLGLTQHLYIEYFEVGEEPGYGYILPNRGTYFMIGRTQREVHQCIQIQTEEEVGYIQAGLVIFLELGPKPIFSSLETIAIASIYGKIDNRWADYRSTLPSSTLQNPNDVEGCVRMFDMFRVRCPRLREFCHRDERGPLALPFLTHSSNPDPCIAYSRTLHFDTTVSSLCLPLIVGHTVKWVSDVGPQEDFATAVSSLNKCLDELIQSRGSRRKRGATAEVAEVDIYCTTNHMLVEEDPDEEDDLGSASGFTSVEGQRRKAKALGEDLEARFRRNGGREDKVRWHASADYPGCVACQSGPPG